MGIHPGAQVEWGFRIPEHRAVPSPTPVLAMGWGGQFVSEDSLSWGSVLVSPGEYISKEPWVWGSVRRPSSRSAGLWSLVLNAPWLSIDFLHTHSKDTPHFENLPQGCRKRLDGGWTGAECGPCQGRGCEGMFLGWEIQGTNY